MPSGPTPSLTDEKSEAEKEEGTNSMSHIKSLAPEPPETLPSGAESTKEMIQEISQHLKPVSEK